MKSQKVKNNYLAWPFKIHRLIKKRRTNRVGDWAGGGHHGDELLQVDLAVPVRVAQFKDGVHLLLREVIKFLRLLSLFPLCIAEDVEK